MEKKKWKTNEKLKNAIVLYISISIVSIGFWKNAKEKNTEWLGVSTLCAKIFKIGKRLSRFYVVSADFDADRRKKNYNFTTILKIV